MSAAQARVRSLGECADARVEGGLAAETGSAPNESSCGAAGEAELDGRELRG